jgi:hypothetical protein
MDAQTVPTHFACPDRDSASDVLSQHQTLRSHFIAHTLDALPMLVLVLNKHRQIVLANSHTLESTGCSMAELLGKRPGEAFGCVHSEDCPGGCGTSEFCSRCGAVLSILLAVEGRKGMEEYNLLRMLGPKLEALDLTVSSSPVDIEGAAYVLFSIQDQSDHKRRRVLERIFFHDMLNTAGGMRGLMDILRNQVPEELRPDADFIHANLAAMVEELKTHKDLTAAENNDLAPVFIAMGALEVLGAAAKMGRSLIQAEGKEILVPAQSADVRFVSDYNLVRRVLGNMLKNALEASRPGETVTLDSVRLEDGVVFRVHNPGAMPEEVRLRVFRRNFSTKGQGRGLGAYGMKLLGERYLGGRVSFTSDAAAGTTFVLSLPLAPEGHARDEGGAAS